MSGARLGMLRMLAGVAVAIIGVAAAIRLTGVPWYVATVIAVYLAILPSLTKLFVDAG